MVFWLKSMLLPIETFQIILEKFIGRLVDTSEFLRNISRRNHYTAHIRITVPCSMRFPLNMGLLCVYGQHRNPFKVQK